MVSKGMGSIIARASYFFQKNVGLIYAIFALPLMMLAVVMFPPANHPDESAHYHRAQQIAGGEIIGQRRADHQSSGSLLDPSPYTAQVFFTTLYGNPQSKVTRKMFEQARAVRFGDELTQFVGFPGSVIYPPTFYLPAAAAIKISQILDLSVINSLYLARFFTGLFSIACAAVGLSLVRRGQFFLLALLCMPMTLALMGAMSQDGPIFGFTILCIGLLSHLMGKACWPNRLLICLTIGIVLLSMARPSYAAFLLIFLCRLPASQIGRMPFRRYGLFFTGLAAVLAWIICVKFTVQVQWGNPEADFGTQLRYLFSHPLHFVSVPIQTVIDYGWIHLRMFIGVLGWNDTWLPLWFYFFSIITLIGLGLQMLVPQSEPVKTNPPSWVGVMFMIILACYGTYMLLYLSWTTVGASRADGVQGRYLIPFAMWLALLGWQKKGSFKYALPLQVIAQSWCVFYALVSCAVFFRVVLDRYYLQ